MLNKKGATTADILSYVFILLFGSIIILGLSLFVVAPAMGDRAKGSVSENIAEFNENIFLFNYLRAPVGDKTITDLVVKAHAEEDYKEMESETKNLLRELYSNEKRICCSWSGTVAYGTTTSYYWRAEGECEGKVVSPEFCLNWRIYLDDILVIDNLHLSASEKTIHEAYIPNYYNSEPIKFRFVFY